MNESIVAIATSVIGVVAAALGTAGGYFFGKKQEIEKARLARALPLAEEISTIVQDLYHMETALADWFAGNFRHVPNLTNAVRYIEEDSTFRSGDSDARQVSARRNELKSKVRAARIYLNANDLDRLETYCDLGNFTYESAGMGGMLFDSWLRDFFANLMDPVKRQSRSELYSEIKKRLNRMHVV